MLVATLLRGAMYGTNRVSETKVATLSSFGKLDFDMNDAKPPRLALLLFGTTPFWSIILVFLLLSSGCTKTVHETDVTDFKSRAVVRTEGGVSVTSVVLSPGETVQSLGYPLADKDIQPIWVEIDNRENSEFLLMLLSVDPNYYSPSEVAWKFRNFDSPDVPEANSLEQRADYFYDRHVPVLIPPRSLVSGFVYTNLDPGRKAYTIDLVGRNESKSLEFFQAVPGFQADYTRVDFRSLHANANRRDLNLSEFRDYLESLPCCTSGGDRKTPGDPLNLVFVGDGRIALAAFARRGWDLTETTRASSVGRMITSSVFKSQYRTSPVSPLYLFDREQDITLQKVRRNVDERNHMRLWRAPVNVNGDPVWVGQISRDIGVKLSGVTGITHKIDPLVDEARLYVTLDLMASGSLQAIGYARGVGPAGRSSGRTNYTKDPYYTDGNRAVLFVSGSRVPRNQIKYLDWEKPRPSRPQG